MTTDKDSERLAFEAWHASYGSNFSGALKEARWHAWQAALSARALPPNFLDEPAMVGRTVFVKGIGWRPVFERAQREYQHKDDPKISEDQASTMRDELGIGYTQAPKVEVVRFEALEEALIPFEIAYNVCGPETEYARGYGEACGDIVAAIAPLIATIKESV